MLPVINVIYLPQILRNNEANICNYFQLVAASITSVYCKTIMVFVEFTHQTIFG